MNKLKTDNTGGWPLELDDMDFAEAAVREAFYGLMSAFGIAPQDSFIISGCAPDSGNYDAGYICLNGEILKVVGAVIPTPGGGEVLYWDLDITYDTAGREQFENSSTNDTYQIRRGKLKSATLTADTYMPFEADTLAEKLATLAIEQIPNVQDPEHTVGDGATGLGTTFLGSDPWTSYNVAVKFFKDINGVVHLSGNVLVPTVAGTQIFQLPVGYRPAQDRSVILSRSRVFSSGNSCRCWIRANGMIEPQSGDFTNAETINFDSISFKSAS